MEDLLPAFRGYRGRSFLVLAVSQVALIQNNQYTIVAYFRVACPGPLQFPLKLAWKSDIGKAELVTMERETE